MKAVFFYTHGGPEVLEYNDYPLSETRAAQKRLEQGKQMGKITLRIG